MLHLNFMHFMTFVDELGSPSSTSQLSRRCTGSSKRVKVDELLDEYGVVTQAESGLQPAQISDTNNQ